MNLKRFIHDIGLWTFPEFAPEGPQQKAIETRPRVKAKDDNVELHTIKGRTFKVQEDHSWERYAPKGTRMDGLSQADEEVLARESGLFRDKYILVKTCMYERMTQKEASEYLTLEHGRGYGLRTVQKYWKAIKAADEKTSPIGKVG